MGPLSRNLIILGADRRTTFIVLSVLCLMLSNQVENVATTRTTLKDGHSNSFVHSSTVYPKPKYECPQIIDVDEDPEVTWELHSSSEPCAFRLRDDMKGFKIAVHLKSCDFDTGDRIEITDSSGMDIRDWYCTTKTMTRYHNRDFSYNYLKSKTTKSKGKSSNGKGEVEHFVDGLTNFTINPKLSKKNHFAKKNKSSMKDSKLKAVIVINIYKDIKGSDSCPDEFFNCYQDLCEETCCPESSSDGDGWSRCIPSPLRCNGNPNCGGKSNRDEDNKICQPEQYCECGRGFCLTWNYVLTSLAIAILFIITPTAIVFALFHRRNVALERARLIRLAQMRMADMRGEFTRDDPFNDYPPSYDDVCDIKEPPPCFCKAIAMQQEYDLRQEHLQQEGNLSSINSPDSSNSIIQIQNLGFQCSCASICNASDETDIPPNYIDVSSERNRNESNDAPPNGDIRNIGSVSEEVFNNQEQNSSEFQDADLSKTSIVWKP